MNTNAYMTFNEFYSYKRDINININDFLCYEILYEKFPKFSMTHPDGVQAFFSVKCSKLVEENEKLARTMSASPNYTTMKETLKSVFWHIITEHKNVQVVKEKGEMINFNRYTYANEKKSYQGGNRMNLSDKQSRQKCCFKCYSVKEIISTVR